MSQKEPQRDKESQRVPESQRASKSETERAREYYKVAFQRFVTKKEADLTSEACHASTLFCETVITESVAKRIDGNFCRKIEYMVGAISKKTTSF